MRWRGEQAKLIQLGKYAPATMNTDLAVLKVILKHAKIELGFRSNAAEDIASFDLSQHPTYSREEPNSLTAAELRDFLAQMRADFPQHYAMTYCGFATGLRPSSLRPLRRGGATPGRALERGQAPDSAVTHPWRCRDDRHQKRVATTRSACLKS
jgi:integrase